MLRIKNSQRNQESERLRVEIYQAERKLEECESNRPTKTTMADAKCDLAPIKSRWAKVLDFLKQQIQAIK